MKEGHEIVLLRIDRKGAILLAGVLALVVGGFALAEQLTLTTSYPVPSGIYNQLITTGNSGTVPADTVLNRNAGNTLLVPATNAGGGVGIGMAPASKLSVAGGVQLGNDASPCTAAKAGTQRWNSGSLQVCDGTAWGGAGGLTITQITGAPAVAVLSCPNNWWASVTCPVGTQLIGGGGQCSRQGSNTFFGGYMHADLAGRTWYFGGGYDCWSGPAMANTTCTAEALCAH